MEDQLWLASESGNLDSVLSLLKNRHLNVNATNNQDENWTALHYASNEGHDHVVEALIR